MARPAPDTLAAHMEEMRPILGDAPIDRYLEQLRVFEAAAERYGTLVRQYASLKAGGAVIDATDKGFMNTALAKTLRAKRELDAIGEDILFRVRTIPWVMEMEDERDGKVEGGDDDAPRSIDSKG
jgi:hypothetical protein